jgi:predicted glycoside hydrolase/deacetylase ChbG (UPF0249 family)
VIRDRNGVRDDAVTRRSFVAAAATAAMGLAGCAHIPRPRSPRARFDDWLGVRRDAPLLIIHADDVGIARSANLATTAAFERGAIDSTSAMVPCPDFPAFAEWVRAHPSADVGVHLTFTSQPTRRWGPVAGADRVPTLVDADGMLPVRWPVERVVSPRELELEVRAQIARARALGVDVTHLDAHQHVLQLRGEGPLEVLLRVARDERLPYRFPREWGGRTRGLERIVATTVPLERLIAISPGVASDDGWSEWYADRIRSLPPGLSELFVHLGIADDELRAVVPDSAPWGAAWRERDLAAVSSEAVARAVNESGTVRIGWRSVRDYRRDQG